MSVTGSFNPLRGYQLYAVNDDYKATVCLSSLCEPYVFLTFRDTGDSLEAELTKEQITHFLSLDSSDDFVVYAFTLCNS